MPDAEKIIDAAIQEWDQIALHATPDAPLATHIVRALREAGMLTESPRRFIFAAARAESERRYPGRPDDDFTLTFTRAEIRAMLRGAFQAGASWMMTNHKEQEQR